MGRFAMKNTAMLFVLIVVATFSTEAYAVTSHKEAKPDGSIVFTFNVSGYCSNKLHTVWGYNIELATWVVGTIYQEMNIPESFTGKFALAPALGIAVSGLAYNLWNMSLKAGNNPWKFTMRARPHLVRTIDKTVGKYGDKICPVPFAGEINDILNAIIDILNTFNSSSNR